MALIPSPDNPIHRMRTNEFAHLVQDTLFEAIGRQHDMKKHVGIDKSRSYTHPVRLHPDKTVRVEHDASPPDDPLGPPVTMVSNTQFRSARHLRKAAGLKPSFKGGLTGAFGDVHMAFILASSAFGKVLNTEKLGNDDAQKARIHELMQQWCDHVPPARRGAFLEAQDKHDSGYAQALQDELAQLDRVPITLMVDGKPKTFMFNNVHIGLSEAPLAQVLFAAGKNAISLSDRPIGEQKFITSAVSNFSQILETTDLVHDYLKAELEKQGVGDAEKILRDSGLAFDSKKAEAGLLKHAPLLKLMDVIIPLADGFKGQDTLAPLLNSIGETTPEHPPIHNAEHGARLLEALAHRVLTAREFDRTGTRIKPEGTSAKEAGIDVDAMKHHLRKMADERPFDVARLAEAPGAKRVLEIARKMTAMHGYADHDILTRALETFDRAVAQQHAIRDEGLGPLFNPAALTEKGARISGFVPSKTFEDHVQKTGINRDELNVVIDEVHHALSGEKGADPESLMHHSMQARALRARNENQSFGDISL